MDIERFPSSTLVKSVTFQRVSEARAAATFVDRFTDRRPFSEFLYDIALNMKGDGFVRVIDDHNEANLIVTVTKLAAEQPLSKIQELREKIPFIRRWPTYQYVAQAMLGNTFR